MSSRKSTSSDESNRIAEERRRESEEFAAMNAYAAMIQARVRRLIEQQAGNEYQLVNRLTSRKSGYHFSQKSSKKSKTRSLRRSSGKGKKRSSRKLKTSVRRSR